MIVEEDFDGHMEAATREAHLANKQVHTITKSNIEAAINEQKEEMATN